MLDEKIHFIAMSFYRNIVCENVQCVMALNGTLQKWLKDTQKW